MGENQKFGGKAQIKWIFRKNLMILNSRSLLSVSASLNSQKSLICIDERSENKRLNFITDQRDRNEG
ncbi:hypothetical protein [uncultured Campylobacter sp.]|uniref:hypothetical protein n=1 Tax=uncultured Campylobacter sp. TaxID=218934 RepID=UPI00261EBA2C|nr:hypothetical protein [uncultured Campylobacter sp.]